MTSETTSYVSKWISENCIEDQWENQSIELQLAQATN